jgi:hypothetical protein
VLNSRRRRALACAGATAALCAAIAPQALAGPLNAGGSVDLLTESNVRIGNLPAAAKVGDKIAAAGDFNGDGIRDIALGMWMLGADGPTRAQAGAIYVVYGKASQGASVDLAALGTNGVRIEGAVASDHAGWSLTGVGDVNADGKDDLLIGTPWADPGTPAKTNAGGARVVYGRAATTEIDLATDTQGFRIDGAGEGDRAGYSVASGDVNGDGRRDFVLGAIGTACRNGGLPKVCEGDAGAAYVVFGSAAPANVDLATLGDGGFRMNGAAGDSKAGWAVAAGDWTGDGKDDVAVSAIWANNYSGATYVVKGKTSGAAVALGALGADGYRLDGDAEDQSGWSLASGDVDGDKKPELVIGVPFHGQGGSLMSGSAYVIKGGALSADMALASLRPGDYRIDGAKTQDGAGWSVATSPDLNGDNIGDVLLGAPGVDRPSGPTLAPAPNSVGPQEAAGAAYVVYGRPSPANVNVGTIAGKGQLLMGGGGFRWSDQSGWNVAGLGDISGTHTNVAAVGVPGWDSNQQTPVGTGRDRGLALLLNGVSAVSVEQPAGGTVPATLSLSLGTPTVSLGSFIPGVAGVYSSSMPANVISTAGDASLSVADPSSNATGRLVNGTFSLPQALQVRATNAANPATVFASLGTGPLALLSYAGPVSNDAVTVGFRQNIAANDPLRTGTYSKTLTFTLSTTTP